jgi:uncharacterized Zn-binding protein involved in type VI secretion
MANASLISKTNRTETIIQEFAKKPLRLGWFSDKASATDTFIYPSTLVSAPVTGGTATVKSTGQPVAATGDTNFSYDPSLSNKPMVANGSQNYISVGVTAANAGLIFTGASFAVDTNGYFRATVRPTVGNSIAYTTPTALPANVWTPVIVPYSKFTTTGTFVATTGAKTIQATGSVVGAFDLYNIEAARTQNSFIGSKLSAQIDCATEVIQEAKRKIENIPCHNFTDATVLTDFGVTINIKTKSKIPALYEWLFGEQIINQLTPRILKIPTSPVVTGTYDTMVALAGLNKDQITIRFTENLVLNSVNRIEDVLDYSSFYYDSTAQTFSFFPGVYTNKTPIQCDGVSLQTANTLVQRNLNTPAYGSGIIGRLTGNTDKETLFYKLQITDIKEKQNKGYMDYTYMFTALPVNINGDYVFFTESIA